jgi:hypothetical protein
LKHAKTVDLKCSHYKGRKGEREEGKEKKRREGGRKEGKKELYEVEDVLLASLW